MSRVPPMHIKALGGVGGPAGPLTGFVSTGFAGRAGRFGTLKAQANYTDGYGALVLIQLQ